MSRVTQHVSGRGGGQDLGLPPLSQGSFLDLCSPERSTKHRGLGVLGSGSGSCVGDSSQRGWAGRFLGTKGWFPPLGSACHFYIRRQVAAAPRGSPGRGWREPGTEALLLQPLPTFPLWNGNEMSGNVPTQQVGISVCTCLGTTTGQIGRSPMFASVFFFF